MDVYRLAKHWHKSCKRIKYAVCLSAIAVPIGIGICSIDHLDVIVLFNVVDDGRENPTENKDTVLSNISLCKKCTFYQLLLLDWRSSSWAWARERGVAVPLLVTTKMDLLPYVQFDVQRCMEYAQQVNPKIQIFQVSALTGTGLDSWYKW